MESKIEKMSLVDCLSITRTNHLNKPWDGKRIWLKAIIKVTKCDSSKNYAIAVNDGKNNPHIVRDFGNMARIVRVDEVYPYYYIHEDQKPDLRNKTDIVAYLTGSGYKKEDIESLLSNTEPDGTEKTEEKKKSDKEYVKALVNEVSIKLQLELLNK